MQFWEECNYMNEKLRTALLQCETDIDGTIERFYGNTETYLALLDDFSKDETMDQLSRAIDDKRWDDAFMAAHALKGLAGNMGFVPLFHSLGEFILLIRAEKITEALESYLSVRNSYCHIMSAIGMSQL